MCRDKRGKQLETLEDERGWMCPQESKLYEDGACLSAHHHKSLLPARSLAHSGLPLRLGRANRGPKEEEVRLSRGLGETAEASTPLSLPREAAETGDIFGWFPHQGLTGLSSCRERILRDLPDGCPGVCDKGLEAFMALVWTPGPEAWQGSQDCPWRTALWRGCRG